MKTKEKVNICHISGSVVTYNNDERWVDTKAATGGQYYSQAAAAVIKPQLSVTSQTAVFKPQLSVTSQAAVLKPQLSVTSQAAVLKPQLVGHQSSGSTI